MATRIQPICLLPIIYLTSALAQANPLVDKLLDSLGGAEIWSTNRFVHTYALNHHPQARLPYTQEGWIDLIEPRHRLELCNFDMQRVRAFTADQGWGSSEGKRYVFDDARMNDELRGWRTRIYRKLRLLAEASKDTDVEIDGARVHVTHGGEYLGWIEVDPQTGAPASAGAERKTRNGLRFGPLRKFGDVAWMASGREPEGWSFETLSFELLPADSEVHFVPRPEDAHVCPSVRK